jgi:hypothetical protein
MADMVRSPSTESHYKLAPAVFYSSYARAVELLQTQSQTSHMKSYFLAMLPRALPLVHMRLFSTRDLYITRLKPKIGIQKRTYNLQKIYQKKPSKELLI